MTHISQDEYRAAFGRVEYHSSLLDELAAEITQETGLTLADIRGRDRRRHFARARQLLMFKARQAGLSLTEIGRFVNRDHTTVMNGVERIQYEIERSKNA